MAPGKAVRTGHLASFSDLCSFSVSFLSKPPISIDLLAHVHLRILFLLWSILYSSTVFRVVSALGPVRQWPDARLPLLTVEPLLSQLSKVDV